jgi:hypothetical protein
MPHGADRTFGRRLPYVAFRAVSARRTSSMMRRNAHCTPSGMPVVETLHEYDVPVAAPTGEPYYARACGRRREDGTWEGWLEFDAHDGTSVLRTGRETTQPNWADLAYWATDISAVYLEGALARALEPKKPIVVRAPRPPAFDGPAEERLPVEPSPAAAETEALEPVLDPFEVYARGESVLRARLHALATWHLRTIARAYGIVPDPVLVETISKAGLVEAIVAAAREASRAAAAPHHATR